MYDSTKQLYDDYVRPDIHYFGIPLMELCNAAYTDSRQRQLFKNVVYVGALSALLDIEFGVLKDLLYDQFKGKQKLIEPNIKALQMGVDYVKEHFQYPLDIRVERRDLIGDSIMIDGNKRADWELFTAELRFVPGTPSRLQPLLLMLLIVTPLNIALMLKQGGRTLLSSRQRMNWRHWVWLLALVGMEPGLSRLQVVRAYP